MAPARRVGIVGGGQLGRMLALAAAPLGVECTVLDPAPDACARVAAEHIQAAYDDLAALERLADWADVVTFEFENVPAAALTAVSERVPTAPAAASLRAGQDRLEEKRLFERLGIATAPYAAVESIDDLRAAVGTLGTPAILKTRRLGYDGKGQARIGDGESGEAAGDEAPAAWRAVAEAPSILERFVPFTRELSVLAVRGASGATAFYPVTENVHRQGILRESRAPASDLPDTLRSTARQYAGALMRELDHVGVLALELFESEGRLLANEFAPRVHNSGHWTIDAAPVSQFENHIRAITGLPLGPTEPAAECVMLNLIGGSPPAEEVLAVPGAHLHLYGKEPRAGRKIGHVTCTGDDDVSAADGADRLRAAVETAAR